MPHPIGPGRHFTGLVNGSRVEAVVYVACGGPMIDDGTGSPVGSQYVSVKRGGHGETGTFASAIWAEFASDPLQPIGLTRYRVRAYIPASLRVPCEGPGTVTFTTCPSAIDIACSGEARDDVVTATFVNVAV